MMVTDADNLLALIPGARPPGRGRGRWLTRRNDGRLRVMVAPTVSELQQLSVGTELLAAQPLDPEALAIIEERSGWQLLPRIVPRYFYAPGPGADIFGTARRYHLEMRPRLVVLPPYRSGPRLTRLLQVAQRVRSRGGEMVLVDGLSVRASLAPLLGRLGLAEYLVLLPPLSTAELAAVLLGADAVMVMDGTRLPRLWVSWAMAAGNPIIAENQEPARAVLGPAALWVFSDTVDHWVAAWERALDDERLREELAWRAMGMADSWREEESVPLWQQALGN